MSAKLIKYGQAVVRGKAGKGRVLQKQTSFESLISFEGVQLPATNPAHQRTHRKPVDTDECKWRPDRPASMCPGTDRCHCCYRYRRLQSLLRCVAPIRPPLDERLRIEPFRTVGEVIHTCPKSRFRSTYLEREKRDRALVSEDRLYISLVMLLCVCVCAPESEPQQQPYPPVTLRPPSARQPPCSVCADLHDEDRK